MKRRVLVVEDDRDIRETLEEVLVAEGYTVEVASNGQEALERLRAAEPLPNLILLDLMMPVKDGLAFREEQQRDPLLAEVPIVIMSADAHIEEKRRRMHVDAAIRKPFDIDLMLQMVAQNLR
ncbi:MAG: response regulator [Labilithrix sp.]|nr:response regulator [Labilithrix sp.]